VQQIIDRREDDLFRVKDRTYSRRNPVMQKKAKKAASAKRGKQASKSAKAMHEHNDVQACGCDFDATDMVGTPDADLPAAKGGVAGATKSARRAGARVSR
jgi:hypothetical protein